MNWFCFVLFCYVLFWFNFGILVVVCWLSAMKLFSNHCPLILKNCMNRERMQMFIAAENGSHLSRGGSEWDFGRYVNGRCTPKRNGLIHCFSLFQISASVLELFEPNKKNEFNHITHCHQSNVCLLCFELMTKELIKCDTFSDSIKVFLLPALFSLC